MKILAALICILSVPEICSAHSGTVINAVSSYLPFIMPVILGAVATCKTFFSEITNKFSEIFNRFKKN